VCVSDSAAPATGGVVSAHTVRCSTPRVCALHPASVLLRMRGCVRLIHRGVSVAALVDPPLVGVSLLTVWPAIAIAGARAFVLQDTSPQGVLQDTSPQGVRLL
jgi:hypothetical protein